jgi:hypothetical protein
MRRGRWKSRSAGGDSVESERRPACQRRASPCCEVGFEVVIGATRPAGQLFDDLVGQGRCTDLDGHLYPVGWRRTMYSPRCICARDSGRSGSASCCSSARRLYTSSSRSRVCPASRSSLTSCRTSCTDAGPAAAAACCFGPGGSRAWPMPARSAPTAPAGLRRWMGAGPVPMPASAPPQTPEPARARHQLGAYPGLRAVAWGPARSCCIHVSPAVSSCARTYSGRESGPWSGVSGRSLARICPRCLGPGVFRLTSAAGSPRPRRTLIQAVAASCPRCCAVSAAARPC